MREILFKGKRLDNGEWIQGYLFRIWERTYICCRMVNDLIDIKEVDPETVCEYTGFADKYSRKIYEGDIIRYINEINGKEKIEEIKYNETYASFCRIRRSEMGLQYLSIDREIADRCEVVGNIFDDLELLDK